MAGNSLVPFRNRVQSWVASDGSKIIHDKTSAFTRNAGDVWSLQQQRLMCSEVVTEATRQRPSREDEEARSPPARLEFQLQPVTQPQEENTFWLLAYCGDKGFLRKRTLPGLDEAESEGPADEGGDVT